MAKTTVQWVLFRYVDGKITALSKPFDSKEQAEQARLKYPEQERRTIGLGRVAK
jgi:hypothetical protein